ncbi:MAG: nitroreductase family protein [Lentisphaerota bacterium]
MSFLDLVRKRFSVRGYHKTAVSSEDLDTILEAGRLAPSAANHQPWYFIVITEEVQRKKLAQAYGRDWFWSAPAILVVCVEPAKAWKRNDGVNFAHVDGAIAMDHMTLCATELGLGTCWVGAFDHAKLKAVLNLPEGIEVVAMTPIGRPLKPEAPEKNRKALSEIVRYEQW